MDTRQYEVFYPYYGKLSTVQRSLYQQFLPEIERVRSVIKVTAQASSADAFAAWSAVYYDHPEFFWMTQECTASTLNGKLSQVNPKYNSLADHLSARKAEFDREVRGFLSAAWGKDQAHKELAVHDKMVREITYRHGTLDQTAYAAIVQKQAVCAGYSRAFQYLMQELGIPCYYCHGQAKGNRYRDWGSHAWNKVKLDRDFYNVDVTWDDCYEKSEAGLVSYEYFNCTDIQFAASHKSDRECSFLPRCGGTRYSYERITGTLPEEALIYQKGVTVKHTIRTRTDFMNYIRPVIGQNSRKQLVISFPANGVNIMKKCQDWFSEAMEDIYHRRVGWSLSTSGTSYSGNWYRIEFNLTIK